MADRFEGIERSLHSGFAGPASRSRFRAVSFAVLLALAFAVPVTAQFNRLFNPELDTDAVGWAISSAPDLKGWDPEDRDGCEGSGSVLISGQEIVVHTAYVAQCIPVSGGETLHFEIAVRPLFASDFVQGSISMLYTTGGCGIPGFEDEFSPLEVLPFGAWSRLAASFVAPAASVSAWVAFQLVSPEPFGAQLDGAHGAEPPPRIFQDGFEYGSACRW